MSPRTQGHELLGQATQALDDFRAAIEGGRANICQVSVHIRAGYRFTDGSS